MDDWSRIPHQQNAPASGRPGGALPAPGSVVMASVEEDLGEGMYALRYAGQRIAVSSRVGLAIGQSLILKSEISPDGKPVLVVQGPALPEPGGVTGRVIYGPGGKGAQAAGTRGDGQHGQAASPPAAAGQDAGGKIAAGVVAAASVVPPPLPPVRSLIGLILEPLPDLPDSAKKLLEAVDREKAVLVGEPAETGTTDAGMRESEAAGIFREGGSGARSHVSAATAAPTPDLPPELAAKEALARLLRAAALPLNDSVAAASDPGAGEKMPEAVADKAVGILLRAAGIAPDAPVLAAARALVNRNVPVDRETVRAMTAVIADANTERRPALLQAAARLLARDVPVSPPLVSGLADVLERTVGTHALLDRARRMLAEPAAVPEAAPLMAAAHDLLEMLHVDLGAADAASVLERFISTFGREALGQALALVEKSAQAVLESNPFLRKIDRALTAVLGRLEEEMTVYQDASGFGLGDEEADSAAVPSGPPGAVEKGKTPPPGSPIIAYIKAPRAVPVQELLKNLPPMPKLARLNDPPPATAATRTEPQKSDAAAPQAGADESMPDVAEPVAPEARFGKPSPPQKERRADAETPFAALDDVLPEASVMKKLEPLFRIPGLNRPEVEVLKPDGFLDRFLAAPEETPATEKIKNEAAALVRRLMDDNSERVGGALPETKGKDASVLREVAARLMRMEAESIRREPLLTRLSEAAASLRELGRQILAVKAENVAGYERQPGIMLAEVPFTLNGEAGDGRMQMFYRRKKKPGDPWTSRVILDLRTTRMGAVLGDLRFLGRDMTVTMFVETKEAAEYLEQAAGELEESLRHKGFSSKMRCLAMPPPAPKLSEKGAGSTTPGEAEEGASRPGAERRKLGAVWTYKAERAGQTGKGRNRVYSSQKRRFFGDTCFFCEGLYAKNDRH